MEKKITCNIFIEGRIRGICKKLDKSLTIFKLRQLLKNNISDEYFF